MALKSTSTNVFGNTEVSYLGVALAPQIIAPGKHKLQYIPRAMTPTSFKMVHSFVGLCNFFHTHIKNFHLLVDPLNKHQCKNSTSKGGQLTEGTKTAFIILWAALTSEPNVAYPRADRQYALIVDASTVTSTTPGREGFILHQVDSQKNFHFIWFMSTG